MVYDVPYISYEYAVYIHGKKIDEKSSYVTADIEERIQNNIPPVINIS